MLPKEQHSDKPADNHTDDTHTKGNDSANHHHHQHNNDDPMTQQAAPSTMYSPTPLTMHESPVISVSSVSPAPSSTLLAVKGFTAPKTPSPRKAECSQPAIASMPIRCLVEQVQGAVNFDLSGGTCDVTAVEEDTFAILPVNTPLNGLVRAALAKLGYSTTDSVNAKGAIQLKNWKPLTFDVITDDKSATIDDILRELKEYTLRIRLSSQPRLSSVEDMKEKLLHLLLNSSHSLLMDTGCPVEKGLLMSLSKGDNLSNVSEDVVTQFDAWYSGQISKKSQLPPAPSLTSPDTKPSFTAGKVLPVKPEPQPSVTAASVTSSHKLPSSSSVPSSSSSSIPSMASPSSSSSSHPSFLPNGTGPFPPSQQTPNLHPSQHGAILAPSKTRIRTSFDPEHEIPRLQKWFQENQHPTREQMVRFMSELNNLDSRKGRRPLDLTNIIYWFKNARAANRRATKALDDSFENEENVDVSNGHPPLLTPTLPESSTLPPYLPNKNAVYIVPYPYHAHTATSNTILSTPDPTGGDSNDEPCDLSIKKLRDTTSNQQEAAKAGQVQGQGQSQGQTNRSRPDPCIDNSELSSGGRSSGGHSRRSSPAHNGLARSGGREEESGYKSPFSVHTSHDSGSAKKLCMSAEKERRSNGELVAGEEKRFLEKHYQLLKEQEDREQRLVMDLKDDHDASSDESLHSNDSDVGRLRAQEEEEAEYVRAQAELRLGLSSLAPTSEASMAALSLAQMSQPPLQIPMSPLNHLAMYYNMPRYYHPPTPHHSQSATAAMVAALSGSAHMNGHSHTASMNSLNHSSSSSSTGTPQSPHPVAIQPAPHPPLSAPHAHSRSSEPRKRRTRVFIDPLTEIPKLEKWFIEDTHPSAYMIDKYTETLNNADYRQKFPKLEPKNVQLWFKNHRAKVKRQRTGPGDESLHDSPPHDGSRSETPLDMVTRDEGGSGSSGGLSSPDRISSKHSDDAADHEHGEESMDEGE
ncbi:uncharacterized protein [Littorina saxatilis]